jgi:hypothetical protein
LELAQSLSHSFPLCHPLVSQLLNPGQVVV